MKRCLFLLLVITIILHGDNRLSFIQICLKEWGIEWVNEPPFPVKMERYVCRANQLYDRWEAYKKEHKRLMNQDELRDTYFDVFDLNFLACFRRKARRQGWKHATYLHDKIEKWYNKKKFIRVRKRRKSRPRVLKSLRSIRHESGGFCSAQRHDPYIGHGSLELLGYMNPVPVPLRLNNPIENESYE